ncbi:MAG TPA: TfuA domain-containing protein, partial [Thermoanaerobaculia bacterium]|nr:TfuA domain-containing protein [Thermoanaerobaculia bacterium]
MKAFIFCGPTLTSGEGAAELDAVFLPPAAQGDVYRATLERPWGIGIVDGYFERLPAIWHKEILWALSRGVHVFGSASMGALRAAELAAFGMEGVGAVFEAFRDGELEDDDEVAVLHGPAESDYRGVTDAMVDIRATLAAAR